MKILTTILMALVAYGLFSCATTAAVADIASDLGTLASDFTTMNEKGYLTDEEAEGLGVRLDEAFEEVGGLEAALEADKDAGGNFISDLSDGQAGGGLLGLLGGGLALANWYRNRRLPGTNRLPEKA